MSEQVSLEPVDAANVTVLVDNFIDALLPSSEVAQRPQVAYEMWEREREQLIAEHGLSLLLTIERDGRGASVPGGCRSLSTPRLGEIARSSSRRVPSFTSHHRVATISTARGSRSLRSASRAS